jgi:hypothetical protein
VRRFDALPDDHPAITGKLRCAVCHEEFKPRDVTVLIPVDAHPEVPGPKTVVALLAHWKCVEELGS